jgi:parvulin-like peptidyl-prolyl isomerase
VKIRYYRYIVLGFLIILLSVESAAGETDKVLASVNGIPITLNEVEEEANRIISQTLYHRSFSPERMKVLRKDALENLIEKELQYQEAKRQGIKVEKKEIKDRVEEVKKRFPSEKVFKEALKKNRLSIKDLETGIERELIIWGIYEKEVEDKVKVSDEDLKNHYENNRDRYRELEKIRIRHIMIKFDPSKVEDEGRGTRDEGRETRSKEEAKAKAEEILKRANSGEDFADLAYRYSEDTYRVKGGDLGYIHRGRMETELEETAFKMNVGDIFGPIETEYGYYIIKVEDRRPEIWFSFDEVRDMIRKELEGKRREERKREWIKELRDGAKIEYQ